MNVSTLPRIVRSSCITTILLLLFIGSALAQDANKEKGFSADRVYNMLGIDSVNTYNGNLILTIPLGTRYPVNGALSYGFTLVYNGVVWDADGDTSVTNPNPTFLESKSSLRSNAGNGWQVSLGRLYEPGDPRNHSGLSEEAFAGWDYESPDGHNYHFNDLADPDAILLAVKESRPVRLRKNAVGERIVEFPDGTCHYFLKDTTRSNGDWRLVRTEDAFLNGVYIDYDNNPGTTPAGQPYDEVWTVRDYEHGLKTPFATALRTHVLYFDHPQISDYNQVVLRRVDLQGFQGQRSTFSFQYVMANLPRPDWDRTGSSHNVPGGPVKVWLLDRLAMDVTGESYAFTYRVPVTGTIDPAAGSISRMRLPTGGSIGWDYHEIVFQAGQELREPDGSGSVPQEDDPKARILLPGPVYRDQNVGVIARTLYDHNDAILGVWSYDHAYSWQTCPTHLSVQNKDAILIERRHMATTVTAPDGTTNVTYYSNFSDKLDNCPAIPGLPGSDPALWNRAEAALPITHFVTRAGHDGLPLGLSTEVRSHLAGIATMSPDKPLVDGTAAAGATVLRSTFARFDDIFGVGEQSASATLFNGDNTCGAGGACYTEQINRDWDGVGHFRLTLNWANFTDGDGNPLSTNTRTSFTNYLAAPAGTDLVDRVEQQCTSSVANFTRGVIVHDCSELGSPRAVQRFCSDDDGFVTRRRVQKGENPADDDIVTTFAGETVGGRKTGNVKTERFFGASNGGAGTSISCDDAQTGTATYGIVHQYQYGAEKKATHEGTDVPLMDQDIDASTGVAVASRDTAGATTLYAYDAAGRLASVSAPGVTPISYVYHPFVEASNTLASVDVVQDASALSNSDVPEAPSYGKSFSVFAFDSLGRVIEQRSLLPDESMNVQRTTWDILGRKTFVGVVEPYVPGATTTRGMTTTYDPFGRALTSRAPDLSQTTVAYTANGIHELTRTARVATSEAAETPVTATERYSTTGKVVFVEDAAGPLDANGEVSAFNRTTYGYDLGDRLASVAMRSPGNVLQTRTFRYNNLGFLEEEQFPEHGTVPVSYGAYDARGHLLSRSDGPAGDFDLRFVYDAAERLSDVNHVKNGVTENVKHFDFFTSNAPGELRNGKLSAAIRHNHLSVGDVVVTDRYTYDTQGRVSAKATNVAVGGSDRQTFTQNYRYSPLGGLQSLDYPTCAAATPCAPPVAGMTMTAHADTITHNGKTVGVRNWADVSAGPGQPQTAIQYHPNGLTARITHTSSNGAVKQADELTADASGMPRPTRIHFSGVCVGPPVNSAEPADATQLQGRPAQLAVTPPATATSYQWYDGASGDITHPVQGANAATFTAPLLTTTKTYWVRVGDTNCSTDSRTATITVVCSGLAITAQPVDVEANGTGRATFTIVATPADATIDWFQGMRGDVSTHAGTGATFVTPVLTQSTAFWARVTAPTAGCVLDSATVLAHVCSPLAIVQQPADATGNPVNGSATVATQTAVSGGAAPYSFQWLDANGTTLNSEQKSEAVSTYTAVLAAGQSKAVHCVVSDSCGHTVTTNVATLSAPDCAFQIADFGPTLAIVGVAGQGLELSAIMSPADTGGTYTYEWFKENGTAGGQSLGSSTQPTHLVTTYSHDAFWVKVSRNGACASGGANYALSPRAYVRVWGTCALEPVTVSPAAAQLDANGLLTLNALTNWPNVRYDWYRGALGDTRTKLSPVTGHNNQLVVNGTPATYWLRITNDCGDSTDSNLVTISRRDAQNSVCDPIVIRGTSADPEIASNALATISVDANSGQGIATYQWRQRSVDGTTDTPIGGSSPSIAVQPFITTIYSVAMTSVCGATAVSRDITVHVTSCGTNRFTTDLPATVQTDDTTDTPLTVVTSAAVVRFDWFAGASGDPASSLLATTTSGSFLLPRRSASTNVWVRATTSGGCSFDSHAVFVDVCVLPAIVETADISISSQAGQYHGIGFTYRGTALHYEWFIGPAGDVANSQPLLHSNDLVQVHPTVTTKYWVRVSNRCGSVNSPNYIISVCPTVADPTASKTIVMPGGSVDLNVSAQGSGLTYHWYRGYAGDRSTPIGGNAATITTAVTTGANTFWVSVGSGSCDTSSNEITMPICGALGGSWNQAITSSKSGQQQIIGIVGVPTAAQVTFYSGTAGNIGASTVITGPSMSYSMTITPTVTTTYWARITANDGICYTDTAPLTIQVCVPQITTQPQAPAAPINAGTTAHLTVVTDVAGSTYQWYTGQSALPGETNATLNVTPSVDATYWVRVTGTCGTSVDSQVVTVTICKPPAIATQPQSTNAVPNGTMLSVGATGTALTYQWYQGAAGITTTPLGTTASVQVIPAQTTSYWIRISGSCGSVDSAVAVVSVCPVITSQPAPANAYVQPGASTTITAAATGSAIAYQWYRGAAGDMTHPVGTNSATLNTGALTTTSTYWVVATSGSCGSVSNTATVNVCNLSINWAGALTQVKANQSQTIALAAVPAGVQATFYTGSAGNVAASTVIAGPSTSYAISVSPAVTTSYWARITDVATGCYADTPALTINVCVPTITTQPQASPAMVNPGGSATLSFAVDLPVTYQWYAGGTAISGATSATYVASPSVDTIYRVRVTGSCSTFVDSNNVTVSVCKPPAISQSPVSTNALVGGTTLSVTATGTALTYQWYQGASGTTTTPIGTNAASITVNPSSTTSYWVKVTGTCGIANSATATVSVCPTITAQPAAAKTYVQPGTSTTITVAATGSSPSYQWYVGTVGDVSHPVGTNSPTLTTAALTSATTYWVGVTSGTCQSQSQTVTVNVCNVAAGWGAATTQVKSGKPQTLTLANTTAGLQATFYTGSIGNTAASTVIGGPSTTYSVVVAPTTTTTYWARVVDPSTGCYADTAALTISVCIPQIAQQPQSVTVNAGASATLQVATDVTPATYQWFTGTTAITGQTAATMTVSPSATTSYWVRVTGSCTQSVDSATATVTVCQPPAVNTVADAPPVFANQAASLGASATGTGLTYQWYVGASGVTTTPVSGATSSTLTRNLSVTEKYWVRVTGTCGTANSNSAWISIYPTITSHPVSVSMNSGSTVTLSVQATGSYLHYQWFRNDTAHPVGTDAPTYATGALTSAQSYFVRVTSGTASVLSNHADVTMCTGPAASLSVQTMPGNCKTVSATVYGDDLGQTSFAWYQGQKGDMSHPIATDYNFYTCATNTDYWVRLTNVNTGCYTDTDPVHVF
jgi:YD repeat-containing protein